MTPRYPRHLTTFDYRGRHAYFLTFCTDRRVPLFTSRTVVDLVLGSFRQAAVVWSMAIVAYCFMPDHLHLLVEGRSDDSSLLDFVRMAKQRSGYAYARSFRTRLWQRYGYERVLRSDEERFFVAAYVVANPVRAGLADDVRQYPFVGSDVYTMEELAEACAEVERHR